MGDLIQALRARVDNNARREVEAYASELDDYRTVLADSRLHARTLDFAVHLRHRTLDHARDDRPFPEEDLAALSVAGRDRGEQGVSLRSVRRVLLLHTRYTLLDLHQAAGPDEVPALLRMLSWLGPQGARAGEAYTSGYLAGQKSQLSLAARVRQLAGMLVTGDPLAHGLAGSLGVPVVDHHLVIVLRSPGDRPSPGRELRDDVVAALFDRYRAAVTWPDPRECVALLGARDYDLVQVPEAIQDRALSMARDVMDMVGMPLAVGTAMGAAPALAEAVALARQTSQAAPVESAPRRLNTVADMFVELAVAHVPRADEWLHDLAQKISTGPDLVVTLNSYYQNDMHRLRTAKSLRIHPRTLDYRLRRARDLTGVDPASTHGVRVLSTVVARIRAARAW